MTQDRPRTGAARHRMSIAVAVAVLVAISGIVGAAIHRSGSSATVPPEPVVTSFTTLPPGADLPSDQECANRVAAASQKAPENAQETVPANAGFNQVRGDQRLPSDFFEPGSGDPREDREIASRVTGDFRGTTVQILQWAACKWGIDERYVRAQAKVESSWRQTKHGDWINDPSRCAPEHGLGVDGRSGECPESFGVLQVRYSYFRGAFPAAITSTAFNLDTAYAVWRACYEGYEWWLRDVEAPGQAYEAGDAWGCIGRWYSGEWYGPDAEGYIDCVQRVVDGEEPCS